MPGRYPSIRLPTVQRLAPLLLLPLLALAAACDPASGGDGADGIAVRDSADIVIVENAADAGSQSWSIQADPLLEIGGDETQPGGDLFRVATVVRRADGGVVVADGAQRLLYFDAAGAHLSTVGREGEGPGEFRAIGWIASAAEDSLVVYDPRNGRVSVFTPSGEHARTVTLGEPGAPPPTLVGRFPDGSFLATRRIPADPPPGGSGIVRADVALSRIASDGARVDSLGLVPADEAFVVQGIVMRPAYLRQTHFALGEQGVWVTPSGGFEIRLHEADGRLARIARKVHPTLAFTEEDRTETPLPPSVEIEFPETLPAISDILLDDSGNLWVEAFAREGEGARAWSVFDPEGHLLTTVALPPRFAPMHIGEDFVLGVWRDDLDVEHVRLHALEKAGR